MKKLYTFSLLLAVTLLVACKGKEADTTDEVEATQEVSSNAAEEVMNAEEEELEELSAEEDVFAVDTE